jgi:methylenetetrahydrofolate dehydrogenase (NADP+)/methenyltetrahydrofolate cyclohydrolase
MLLIESSARRELRGVRACVVGRSGVVGLPVALMLIARDATVTVVHSRTHDLPRATRDAEVLVVATGRPGMITAAMVAPGATVVDVGTTYVDGKVTGDVAPDVAEIAGEITPVPGGVGPVTSAALLQNVVSAAEAASR